MDNNLSPENTTELVVSSEDLYNHRHQTTIVSYSASATRTQTWIFLDIFSNRYKETRSKYNGVRLQYKRIYTASLLQTPLSSKQQRCYPAGKWMICMKTTKPREHQGLQRISFLREHQTYVQQFCSFNSVVYDRKDLTLEFLWNWTTMILQ